MDLEPGLTLRIVVPLLTSGGFVPKFDEQQTNGNTITLSSRDVIGYSTATYAINRKKEGKVRLDLVSSEETKDGKTVAKSGAPSLPFALPKRAAHIRLLYLIRYSESDHGTAILAADRGRSQRIHSACDRKPQPLQCGGQRVLRHDSAWNRYSR